MPKIKSEGISLFYESEGAGPPLVLIPGFAAGAWLWFRQVEEFSKDFRVITFDPRGISRSAGSPAIEVSIALIANDIQHLLDELEIKKASVLGTSFGGFVAQEFALKFPERMERLVLACTSHGGKGHVLPENYEVLSAFAFAGNLNAPERIRKFMIPAFTKNFAEDHFDIVEKTCEQREGNPVEESVYLKQLAAAASFDAEGLVPGIKSPTLIISGNSDQVVPVQNSINLGRLIPGAKIEIMEGCGHLFFIERAHEFNAIVKNFLLS